MARRTDYGKSRPAGNERDFSDEYNWSSNRAGKHNDWLTTNTQFLLPRVAYPAHRTPVSQGPFYARRSNNVGVVASRYPVYTAGGFGDTAGSEASFSSNGDDRKKKKKSSLFLLCITLVILFVLVAIALAIVAIYLASRDNDKESYVGTYEAKVRMADKVFDNKLGDVTSVEFSKQQDDFCSKTKESFDGAVKDCVVDAFSNGSLVVESSLEFDLDKLETLVKKGGSVPIEKTIVTTIERIFTANNKVTIKFVRREPEFLSFRLRTWMKTTTATESAYCDAIKKVYGDSFEGCEMTTKEDEYVNATIRLNTKTMKKLARGSHKQSDITGIRSVVREKLVKNKVEFFTTNEFEKDRSEVDDFSAKTLEDEEQSTTPAASGSSTSTPTASEDSSSQGSGGGSQSPEQSEVTTSTTNNPTATTTTTPPTTPDAAGATSRDTTVSDSDQTGTTTASTTATSTTQPPVTGAGATGQTTEDKTTDQTGPATSSTVTTTDAGTPESSTEETTASTSSPTSSQTETQASPTATTTDTGTPGSSTEETTASISSPSSSQTETPASPTATTTDEDTSTQQASDATTTDVSTANDMATADIITSTAPIDVTTETETTADTTITPDQNSTDSNTTGTNG